MCEKNNNDGLSYCGVVLHSRCGGGRPSPDVLHFTQPQPGPRHYTHNPSQTFYTSHTTPARRSTLHTTPARRATRHKPPQTLSRVHSGRDFSSSHTLLLYTLTDAHINTEPWRAAYIERSHSMRRRVSICLFQRGPHVSYGIGGAQQHVFGGPGEEKEH